MARTELEVTRHAKGEYTVNGWRVRQIRPGRWDIIATDGLALYWGNTLDECKDEISAWIQRALAEDAEGGDS